MKLLQCSLCFVLIVNYGSLYVSGCGITTHIEVGYRAKTHFDVISDGIDYKKLIERHEDAFQAGSQFPDAFYPDLCRNGTFHSNSEDTHWTPFLNASINYVRRQYPKPWNETTEKLVAFIFGVVSHQVADVNWHSLGIDQAFLRTMGKVNYHGSYDNAHSDGDFGGDVVNIYELDQGFIDPIDTWYIPVQDLVNIYRDFYGDGRMTADVIEECSELLYLGRLGEKVVDVLFPDVANRSTFLVDKLNDFFLGGLDDMAVWVSNTWNRTVYMLDNGVSACDVPRNPIYIRCNETKSRRTLTEKDEVYGRDHYQLSELMLFESSDVNKKYANSGGVYFSLNDDAKRTIMKLVESVANAPNQERAEGKAAKEVYPYAMYTSSSAYSRLGTILAAGDVTDDGFSDLLIGAPLHGSPENYQRGIAYIIRGGSNGLPSGNHSIDEVASLTLQGSKRNGRFGHAVVIVDLNADGINDIAIGAPSVGSTDLNFQGEVYVFYGNPSGDVNTVANITVTCQLRYCNLGWSLASGDLDGDGHADLVLGAPFSPAAGGEQSGFVGVIYSKPALSGTHLLNETELDWRHDGQQAYQWFGHSVEVKSPSSGNMWLLVGSPTYRLCAKTDCSFDSGDTQAVGRVDIFAAPLGEGRQTSITGREEFQQLGWDFDVGKPFGDNRIMLALSSPSISVAAVNASGSAYRADQSGSVRLVDVTNLDGEAPTVTEFHSERDFSRFGTVSMLIEADGDMVDDFIVSAPLRTEDTEDLSKPEEGGLLIYKGGPNFPSGNVTYTCAPGTAVPCSLQKLVFRESKSRFGSSVAVLPHGQQRTTAVSAPRSNTAARLGGAVLLFNTST